MNGSRPLSALGLATHMLPDARSEYQTMQTVAKPGPALGPGRRFRPFSGHICPLRGHVRSLLLLGTLLLVAVVLPLAAQAAKDEAKSPEAAAQILISVERETPQGWQIVDPAQVLDSGTRLRFRFKSSFPGYLYVMNQGTSGAYVTVFPGADSGIDNRVTPGEEITVPQTDGVFRLTGPSGYDVLFWVLAPARWAAGSNSNYRPLPPPPQTGSKLNTLTPRCDDSVFRARGECVDVDAGIQKVEKPEQLPSNVSQAPGLQARDLAFEKGKEVSVVKVPAKPTGPVVYEMRIAHK